MKHHRTLALAAALALLGVPNVQTVQAAEPSATAITPKEGWYHQIVNASFVAGYAILPKPEGVMIIDSRPTARKYDIGHIPTAISIPDSQFEQLTGRLPVDKDTLLIFYCDGPECRLSHDSAFKAEKLGYTRVHVYAAGYPDWVSQGHIGAVSIPYIKKLQDEGAPMTLIDSRPKERKYDKGHIPGAISIPDLQFDKLVDRLPTDKASPLYFYCEGLSCTLSSDSAARAVKLGYTRVKVVPEGYPEWVRRYGPGPTTDTISKPAIQVGRDTSTITVASFERIYREAPDTIHLIDVRDPAEFAKGSFKGAMNFPIKTLERRIGELPSDKPIVFFCGAGGRSGEAHDLTKQLRPQLVTYFIDAEIKWSADGSHTITE